MRGMRMMMIMGALGGLVAADAYGQLAPPRQSVDPGSPQSAALSSQSAQALVGGRPAEALRLADQAVATDVRNPWAHYDRAAALADLGRTDDALKEFKAAEARFSTDDPWGRSVAMFGRANLLAQAGRCAEAVAAFRDYARFVEQKDPGGAALARQQASACQSPR